MNTINNRIKILRKKNNLTLEKFGERIGVKKSTISNIENSRFGVTEQMIKSICREFKINEFWLRNGTGDIENSISKIEDFNFSDLSPVKERIIGAATIMTDLQAEFLWNFILHTYKEGGKIYGNDK